MTKVVLSVDVALHVLPLELILATSSAAHTVPLIAHAVQLMLATRRAATEVSPLSRWRGMSSERDSPTLTFTTTEFNVPMYRLGSPGGGERQGKRWG